MKGLLGDEILRQSDHKMDPDCMLSFEFFSLIKQIPAVHQWVHASQHTIKSSSVCFRTKLTSNVPVSPVSTTANVTSSSISIQERTTLQSADRSKVHQRQHKVNHAAVNSATAPLKDT